MSRFLSPVTPLVLAVLFLVSGWIGGPENALDVRIVEAFAAMRQASPWSEQFALRLTFLGSGYVTLGLAMGGTICLLLHRDRVKAAVLLFSFLAERFTMDNLKLLYARPRPFPDLHAAVANGFSYPSGHTSNSMTVFVLFALLVVPETWRKAALWIAISLAVAVGVTRPFLGMHWPSDVIGGWCLAGIAIWVAMHLEKRFSPASA